jgi:predicted membrane protein
MLSEVDVSLSPTLWIILAVLVVTALAAWFWVIGSRELRQSSASPAVFSLLRNVTEDALPADWTDEQIVALLGDVKLDLRNRAPGERATLRVFHFAGDLQLRVSAGAHVTTSGGSLFGDHRVDVEATDPSEVDVRAWSVFGDVIVTK